MPHHDTIYKNGGYVNQTKERYYMENTNRTARNRTTRMRIGESILLLLDRGTLSDITISKIVKTAGVSRMTFYHYYETKEEALQDFLAELISLYVMESKEKGMDHQFHTQDHLVFTLNFFSQYDHFFLKMEQIGCYSILINGVNQFLEDFYSSEFQSSIYNLYYYAGALLNVFIKWLRNGKKESAATLAALILSAH